MKKVFFYTDKSFLPANTGHLELLYPFWGSLGDPINWEGLDIYKNYVETGHDFFEVTDNPNLADYALLPNDYKRYERKGAVGLAKSFVKKAFSHGLKTIVFYHSDFEYKIPLKNVIVFRTSLSRRDKGSNEYALPGWNGDLLRYFSDGKVKILSKQSGPSLGFCGAARANSLSMYQGIKHLIKKVAFKKKYRFNALQFRFEIIQRLAKSELIKTDFIIRNSYLGGAKGAGHSEREKLRQEYFENLVANPYTLCVRGVGNFSYRFYEALSVGRIPVLVDTECVLPFDEIIEWNKIILRVHRKDINSIDRLLFEHFNSFNESEFLKIQSRAREIWERYLSPEGFFRHLNLVLTKLH